ncbi:globin domain-containing protein [Streptomyces sp. TR06-5]|uniref:globin domain-containing protein n=1 Tax=unclassified Streptomyces TaxID=2593676 RepID=UPI0039A3D86A
MTTTSAGNGASPGDSGEWSWFAPAKKSPPHPQDEGGQEREDGPAPHRPVAPIRPVGSGPETGRYREATSAYGGRGPGAPASPYGPTAPRGQEHAQPFEDLQRVDARAPHPGHTPAAPPAPAAPALPPAGQAPGAGEPAREPSADAVLIRRTLEEIGPVADSVTAYFYAMLFVQHPQLRELFPASMDAQRDRLLQAILTAARLIDDPEPLTEYLSHLGRGHRKYGTSPEHYPAVGECLLGALAQYATVTWSDEAEAAWVRAYTAISQTMIDAAAEDEKHAPAWWNAEIVSHEMRTRDIAVITVRPDQPYPFLAGQYTTLETPWWPRVWRHYSFAAAPRSDGLLSFHVRSVPAGWVSSALVNRARPGDVIRLGPPAGSMTVDHAAEHGLLCLGGGTGIAPIKALVEDVAEHGRSRPVEVFYGARHDHELYDLQTMQHLEQRHPWLSVRPVVSTGGFAGRRPSVNAEAMGPALLSGDLPEVVQQHGPWSSYVGYLSGPPGLIRSGVDVLRGAGIPPHRIRHDSLEELVAAAE